MKLKTDFVTNSSSTCYIVFIPDGFEVNIDLVKAIFESNKGLAWCDTAEEGELDFITSAYNTLLRKLHDGHNVTEASAEALNVSFRVFKDIIFMNGLTIKSFESSNLSEDFICGISKRQLSRHILDNYFDETIDMMKGITK